MVRLTPRDSVPQPGAQVVLHRVGRDLQGPVDSTVADAHGRFRFRFVADTSSVYLVSAHYAGIEYFATPVATNPVRPDTAIVIAVSDTSSRAATVELQARHIVISHPGPDGSRPVLELLVLHNGGWLTRVPPDSLHPSWSMRLPAGAVAFEAGEGDVSPDAVMARGDSVLVFAPLGPGEKQMLIRYDLPATMTTVAFPFPAAVASLNLLLEEEGAKVRGAGLAAGEPDSIEGRRYTRWTGVAAAGAVVTVGLADSRRLERWILPALAGALGLVLLAAAVLLLRRRPVALTAVKLRPREDVVEALARLDARYLGRERDVDAAEWAQYREERTRLLARAGGVAGGGGTA